jgi:hypothetical protein
MEIVTLEERHILQYNVADLIQQPELRSVSVDVGISMMSV